MSPSTLLPEKSCSHHLLCRDSKIKNHLGDRDEHLPTNHGFDEFFGNLYHLNARRSRRTRITPKTLNAIVFYSTDNGSHYNTWPDAAATPFRGEKNTNWEGDWRVPAMVRWSGKIPAGSVSNEIVHHMDWLPTFLAVAGDPDIKNSLKKGGVSAIGRSYKVHLDGYNIMPLLTGKAKAGPPQ